MVNNVDFVLVGDLYDFLFCLLYKGVFCVEVLIQDVMYQFVLFEVVYNLLGCVFMYLGDWLVFININGMVIFDWVFLVFKVVCVKVMGVNLQDVNGSLFDMGDYSLLFIIDGCGDGVMQNFL